MDIWDYIRIHKIDENNVDEFIKKESHTWSGCFGGEKDWQASPKGLEINTMEKYGTKEFYKWYQVKEIVLRGKQLSWF